jgi:hypothetical protein
VTVVLWARRVKKLEFWKSGLERKSSVRSPKIFEDQNPETQNPEILETPNFRTIELEREAKSRNPKT